MLEELKSLQKKAYVPYSDFRVACIVLLKNKAIVKGVNVENASYPVGICAERSALSQVYSLGYRKIDIERIYLLTDSNNLAFPCGMCRQFIGELCNPETLIEIHSSSSDVVTKPISDLLPFGFSKDDI